jgi:anti-sigma factor RsiW
MTNANESALEDDFLLLHAYLDGELDPADTLVVGRKIAANPALSAELERTKALRQTVSELPRRTLPPHLRSRVDAAFGSKRQPARSSWQALAASTLLAFMLGGGSTWLVLHPVASERTAEAVVDSHMRGLMASRPTDVASSERHTVKPWFNGRIPQAPRVVDLAQDGFPLVGARVDVIGNTPVPTLVYGRRLHVISLSAIPEPGQGDQIKAHRSINGYNVVSWREGGIGYWAISDLAVGELDTFARLFKSSPS